MTELTPEQKRELILIANDKFSVGAFAGMCTNLLFDHPDLTEVEVIQKAINMRLTIKELTKTTIPKPTLHSK